MYTIAKDYTWDTKIASYDAGRDQRLRLSNQLKLQQEVGELHLGGGGLDYREFRRHGMVFVLTRANSVIYSAPVLDQPVKIKTWHRDTRGAQFFRCYQFLDAQGNVLIDSVSAFALVDAETHRLLRPSAFDSFGVETQPERRNNCPDPAKWKMPESLSPVGERRVFWSDTDYNGHMNNTNYADVLCDFLPGGMEGRRITGFSLAFLREALEGDTLEVNAVEQGGEAWVSADHARGRCFEARLTFEEE